MDSKTAKKIEVQRCKLHAPNFEVTINGRHEWCGTEAEAQAKAAELGGECTCNRMTDPAYCIPCRDKAAAAQPTETRTPQDSELVTHEEATEAALTLIDAAFRNGKRQTKFHIPAEEDDTDRLIMRYIKQQSARAAAPVDPPKDVDLLMHDVSGERSTGIRTGKIISNRPATELVEPAPRPQSPNDKCARIDCGHFRKVHTLDGGCDRDDCICGEFLAAASSPAARPQQPQIQQQVPCRNCDGRGIAGYATAGMANDAGDPNLHGITVACSFCDGNGYTIEYTPAPKLSYTGWSDEEIAEAGKLGALNEQLSNIYFAVGLHKRKQTMTDLTGRKPILGLDFDGVCHSYASGWKGAANIPDEPVIGTFEALRQYSQHFELNVYSARSNQDGGIAAMREWFEKHEPGITDILKFPTDKPPAFVSIDDRVITFTGAWPSVEALKEFKPWNAKQV